jgi:hypothetical protein
MGDASEDLLEVGVGGEGGGQGGRGGRHGDREVVGGEGFGDKVMMGFLGGGGQDGYVRVMKARLIYLQRVPLPECSH